MKNMNFTTSFLVDQSPREVFDAINNVRGWWTENLEGNSKKLHDEFEVRFEDVHYSKQKLVEIVPDKKVVWLVTDSKLTFVEDTTEWTNTRIVFDMSRQGSKTKVTFSHEGLVPKCECFEGCSGAWRDYINNSLSSLITSGQGRPERRNKKQKVSNNS